MKVSIIIPARMAATRFPGKPLSSIAGKPMIQWVWERARASVADRVIVATDSPEIYSAVQDFGGEAMMTASSHENGTQRIAEVAAKIDSDLVINVQGDEPAILPSSINKVIAPLVSDHALEMSTLACSLVGEQLFDPNVVKVVTDKQGCAMYFSRSPIPFRKHAGMRAIHWETIDNDIHLQHIGVYGFRRSFLLDYVAEPPCALERIEGLEQLRALYMGARIRVKIVEHASVGVDTPEDIPRAEQFLRQQEQNL